MIYIAMDMRYNMITYISALSGETMKIISFFNNKGGVGRSTLTYHLAHALAEMCHKTLIIDLDPQCNISLQGIGSEQLNAIWEEEDRFIADYESACANSSEKELHHLLHNPRSIHFHLKPTEDGLSDFDRILPTCNLAPNLDLIPGRLSLHTYEHCVVERWNTIYAADVLAIRTITQIRAIAEKYAESFGYEYILIDLSPSLGVLNKAVLSTVDGIFIPALPDMFSIYGIKNLHESMKAWEKERNVILSFLSKTHKEKFPKNFARILGYTIFNAKSSAGLNGLGLSNQDYGYFQQIVDYMRVNFGDDYTKPLGPRLTMFSHGEMVRMAQKYRLPMWLVPDSQKLLQLDKPLIKVKSNHYSATRQAYLEFACNVRDILHDHSST